MKYFVNHIEDDSKEYFMFCMGYFNFDYTHKKNDIFLYADLNKKLQFHKIFGPYHDEYPYMEFLEINPKQWEKIKEHAAEIGGETKEAIDELDEWVKLTFTKHDVFAIVGLD